MKKRFLDAWRNKKGMGVIEVVLIIAVLVGLAIIFKSQITAIANSLFNNLVTQVESF